MQHGPPGPSASAMHSAGSLASGGISQPFAMPARGAHPPATGGNAGPSAGLSNTSAPLTILMGGDATTESALLQTHEHSSSHQPFRVVMGPTLGGQFVMLASTGEFRGSAFSGPLSYGWSSTVVMSHGHGSSPHMGAGGLISGGHAGHFGRGGHGGWHGGRGGSGHFSGHLGGFGLFGRRWRPPLSEPRSGLRAAKAARATSFCSAAFARNQELGFCLAGLPSGEELREDFAVDGHSQRGVHAEFLQRGISLSVVIPPAAVMGSWVTARKLRNQSMFVPCNLPSPSM